MKTALMMIDVQNIMLTEEGGAHEADLIISRISRLLGKAREEAVPVIYIQHTEKEGELAEGRPGWEICRAVAPREGEAVVRKGSWDAFLETELDPLLKRKGIERLVICGMQTEFCVDTTLRSAYARGYRENIAVSDGHTTFDSEVLPARKIRDHHNRIWGGRFARLIEAEHVEFR